MRRTTDISRSSGAPSTVIAVVAISVLALVGCQGASRSGTLVDSSAPTTTVAPTTAPPASTAAPTTAAPRLSVACVSSVPTVSNAPSDVTQVAFTSRQGTMLRGSAVIPVSGGTARWSPQGGTRVEVVLQNNRGSGVGTYWITC